VRALYFGTYDASYPRNAQVISCLRSAGVEVVERRVPVWGRHNWRLGLGQLARVARAERVLARTTHTEADVLIVGYPGHFDIPAARRVAAGRPLVFNPLVSLHDTLVTDRRRFGRRSPAAGMLRQVDRIAFGKPDLVVADTEEHARFYTESLGVPRERLGVAFVGAEDAIFRPGWQPPVAFHALHVGKLIPLHGLDTILEAAKLAPEIPFRIVGDGQLEGLLDSAAANVDHSRWLDYTLLPAAYRAAGCALGIFGTGAKAGRVIPNKVFQALACGAAVVTGDTPAARELLTDGRDALLVPPGDPEALAAAIRRLAASPNLATEVGEAGRRTYERRASEVVLGEQWRELLERVIAAR